MALREVEGPPGPPWGRRLSGAVDELVVESELLAGNPLGDPSRRPLLVYRSPGVVRGAEAVPAVYVIQGFTGQVDRWLSREAFEPTIFERLDAMYAQGTCAEGIVVFVDAWTSRGGSQFLNSSGTGRYLDYLCDEVVPFVDGRYPTRGSAAHRGLAGKSSGGYGAMVVPMLRPDVFGALASHAGDALFECSLLPQFPEVVRTVRAHGGQLANVWQAMRQAPSFDWSRFGSAFEIYGYACAYTPDPERPGEGLLPFDLRTGRLDEELWARWLARDPVRMVSAHAAALRGMRRILLEAGRSDEAFLDLGAQAVAAELDRVGAQYTLELFEGRHGGIGWRYPGAIRELMNALG
jgi:enterochelin esterase-like enzyme